LVATFGLRLVLVNVGIIAWKGDPRGLRYNPGNIVLGGLSVPLGGVYVGLASLGIIAISHVFLSRTYLGNAIRAYSQDIAAAKLMGVNPTSVAAIATGIGFAMTMAGGAFLTVYLRAGITPFVGLTYAPISFVIVVRIYATSAYSINLVAGMSGYVSFGHVVFVGTGRYGLGYGVKVWNLPPFAGVALGGVLGAVLALVIGVVTLGLRGAYFAIAP